MCEDFSFVVEIYECAMVARLKGICRLKIIAAFIFFGADTQSSIFDTIY